MMEFAKASDMKQALEHISIPMSHISLGMYKCMFATGYAPAKGLHDLHARDTTAVWINGKYLRTDLRFTAQVPDPHAASIPFDRHVDLQLHHESGRAGASCLAGVKSHVGSSRGGNY